jgi:hypothetical protein
MAYRFILEVPESIGEEAKIVVDQAPEAEVLIARHSRPVDSTLTRREITVVAHSLEVIDQLYSWLRTQDEAAKIELEPFGGPRVHLSQYSSYQVKALIQGDQYWMETTMPNIAHLSSPGTTTLVVPATETVMPAGLSPPSEGPIITVPKTLEFFTSEQVLIRVRDIRWAETVYRDLFEMDVVIRARRAGDQWEPLPRDFDWEVGIRTGVYPELAVLQHEPLSLVLLSVGRGSAASELELQHVNLVVSPKSLLTLRAKVLMHPFPMAENQPHYFTFRDPYGTVWHISDGTSAN